MEIRKNITYLIIVLGLMGVFSCNFEQKTEAESNMATNMEQKLRSDLPVGTSKTDIENYLTKNNIEHSWVEKERKFYAIIRNVETEGVVSKNISIVVSVDTSMQLSEIKVEPIFTGP